LTIKNSLIAFLFSIPIAMLGGLIGVGGAEYRLPVLIGILKRSAHQSVPINLAVSLITLLTTLFTRLAILSDFPLVELLPVLLAMILSAMLTAFIAAGYAARIPAHLLETWIKYLLMSIGLLLVLEGFLPIGTLDLLLAPLALQIAVGLIMGGLIGIVSSTLGVAGGELIIPTLIFIFGVGVKIAGTASVIISLPIVITGLIRYYHARTLFDRAAFQQIVIPMGLGSVIGSIAGGLLLGLVSQDLLKIILGFVLIGSAARLFSHARQHSKVQDPT
jgi:uncharacterized protein